ncbi:MAG: GNAT family N-acetyltransferase [Cyanobacteria bacterium J06600_6]
MSNQKLKFSIRPYEFKDSNAVNQLCKKSIEALCASNYNSQQVEALASLYHRESDGKQVEVIDNIFSFVNTLIPTDLAKPNAIVAHLEDHLIGYASIRNSWISNDSLLAQLFVDPEYARRGVATELLRTLENNVMDESKVVTIGATLTGEPFYQANGYQTIEQYSSFIGGVRIPFVHMEKWLTTPWEIEKFFWDTSRQGMRNIEWLATETEALLRSAFNEG